MNGISILKARVRAGFAVFAGCLLALLSGCAPLGQLVPQTWELRSHWPQGVPQTVELTQVPFFPQDEFQCGPAALATVLAHTGVPITPEPLVSQVWLPSRQGSLQVEMLATPRRYNRISYVLAPSYADMLREVAAGNPVLVLQDIGAVLTQWHYAVINGFDYSSGTVFLRSGTQARQEMPFTAFERTWIKSRYWAMVTMPPDKIPATAAEDAWMTAVLAMARTGDGASITTAYETALRRWPDNLQAAIGLANEHHSRGSLITAAAILRRALLARPKSVVLINNLAQTLSDQGRHGEALTLLGQADTNSPFGEEVRSTRELIEQRIEQQRSALR
jgi:hypothetical protein